MEFFRQNGLFANTSTDNTASTRSHELVSDRHVDLICFVAFSSIVVIYFFLGMFIALNTDLALILNPVVFLIILILCYSGHRISLDVERMIVNEYQSQNK